MARPALCLRAFIYFGTGTGGTTAARPGEDRPPAQIARDDRGSLVLSIAFAPGDTRLASTTQVGDVWLKDLAGGPSPLLRQEAGRPARSVAFSPGGEVLAVAGGTPLVELWDLESDEELTPLEVGGEATKWVAFSPDGATLAAAHMADASRRAPSRSGTAARRRIAVLDAQGEHHRPGLLPRRDDAGDGEHGGRRRPLGRGDGARTDEPAGRLVRHTTGVTLAFSADGTRLATATFHGRSVRLWSAATGRPLGAVATSAG